MAGASKDGARAESLLLLTNRGVSVGDREKEIEKEGMSVSCSFASFAGMTGSLRNQMQYNFSAKSNK